MSSRAAWLNVMSSTNERDVKSTSDLFCSEVSLTINASCTNSWSYSVLRLFVGLPVILYERNAYIRSIGNRQTILCTITLRSDENGEKGTVRGGKTRPRDVTRY